MSIAVNMANVSKSEFKIKVLKTTKSGNGTVDLTIKATVFQNCLCGSECLLLGVLLERKIILSFTFYTKINAHRPKSSAK